MEAYLGDIRMFAGDFSPRGWEFCNGQLLRVSEHVALFSLIGTLYGGDGETTFALPDMRGRVPMHTNPSHAVGESQGSEAVSLTANQLPAHTHSAIADSDAGTSADPTGHHWANSAGAVAYSTVATGSNMSISAIQTTGESIPHENRQPYQCISFMICVDGIYPSRG